MNYPALIKILSAIGLILGLNTLCVFQMPVLAEALIPSDRLIEKLAPPPPPLRTRGLVKTIGPEIGASASAGKGPEVTTGSVMLKIQFAHNSSALSIDSQAQLHELGKALNSQQLAPYVFEIAGHTDGRGKSEYNRQLSIRRANAVKAYLSSNLGVGQYRLKTVGWGEDRPLISQDPYHPDNRRVEIINRGR